MRVQRNTPVLVSAAIFILLEIAACALISHSSPMQNIWFSRFSHRTMALLWGGGERIRSFVSLKEQNAALSEENRRLTEELLRCRTALDLGVSAVGPEFPGWTLTSAQVVRMSRNNSRNYIVLNRGSEDGVVPNSGIISASGVVGVVSAVGKHYSYGMTLKNVGFSVSARMDSGAAICSIRWDGRTRDGAYARDLTLHEEVVEGDTVRTSGLSSIFPSGIPLGVVGKSHIRDGVVKELDVRLFEDYSAIGNVFIVKNQGLPEMEAVEKEAER